MRNAISIEVESHALALRLMADELYRVETESRNLRCRLEQLADRLALRGEELAEAEAATEVLPHLKFRPARGLSMPTWDEPLSPTVRRR